ncbi:helix-turn-helix domain-containing protein [Shewanella corallii]|uniref:Helix-turn-helix domain-containing protein n=1 Tax=Shewanella corallii TaxID=560080 RepID=A0ABT0NDF8_9GAMM|nr:helix-turn-helix domain-containing protein [Shewanella corallii]MCL2916491.1 helix-turn-helix domain-containing protein [Shewanella corallii]
MKTVMILAAGNVVASGISSFLDVFSFCNVYWKRIHPEAENDLFHVHVVSPDGEPALTNQGFQIPATGIKETDLNQADAVLLASAFVTDESELMAFQRAFAPFVVPLTDYAKTGKPIAAYCSGTLVLASTGLMNGVKTTTVWWLTELFKQRFPQAHLCMDSLVVSDCQFHTAGATSSCLSLALHMVEQLAGVQVAHQLSKVLLVAPNRSSQQPFMTMSFQLEQHQDSQVQAVQEWMQQNLTSQINLDELAGQFAMGKRTLIRRFKSALNETPGSYWQKLRIDEAKRLLETTDMALEQIIDRVGYGDSASFRKLFQQQTSLSPRAYRAKFNSHTCC